MTLRSSFPIALALALAPVTARAQSRSPAAPTPTSTEEAPKVDTAFEYTPRQPDTLVTLSLENAELPELVRTISEMTGRRFVVASSPKSFQATVVAPQKVTVATERAAVQPVTLHVEPPARATSMLQRVE
jgi:general secretion pathway protein D